MVPRGRERYVETERNADAYLSFGRAESEQGEDPLALPSPPSGLTLLRKPAHSLTPDDGASHFAPNPFCPISNFSGRTLPPPHPRRVAAIGAFYVIAIGKLALGTQAKLRLER